MQASKNSLLFRKNSELLWLSLLVVVISLGFVYEKDLWRIAKVWIKKPEYSYGFLIPIISLYLVWQQKTELQRIGLHGSWVGLLVVLLSIAMIVFGRVGLAFLVGYSLIIILTGVALSLVGWQGLRVVGVPIFFLIFMIPLPVWLYLDMSGKLRLLSSELGVTVIRALGVSVFREGNIIDLGNYKLQVLDACDGLRYLFPLMSFSFLCAYLLRTKLWMRVLVFVSSIPIAVLMNGLRIGITGFLVEHKGIQAAEGFLHYFEGWILFVACLSLLFIEMWLLAKIGGIGRLKDVFLLDRPRLSNTEVRSLSAPISKRSIPNPYLATLLILALAALIRPFVSLAYLNNVMPAKSIPSRAHFSEFPMKLGAWKGKRSQLLVHELDMLKPTDYLMVNYENLEGERIEIYAAYWKPEKGVGEPHPPTICIPASGWTILDASPRAVDGVLYGDAPLIVKRVSIVKLDDRRLVYYWFQQGGRLITNELARWWYRYWHRFSRQRKDRALVRIVTPLGAGDSWEDADQRLSTFTKVTHPMLVRFIPDEQ